MNGLQPPPHHGIDVVRTLTKYKQKLKSIIMELYAKDTSPWYIEV